MKFLILIAFFFSAIHLNAQQRYYYKDRDTIKPKTSILDIEITEIDSTNLKRNANLGLLDSAYFVGNIIAAFVDILKCEYAYLKITGTVPKVFIKYHVYLDRDVKNRNIIDLPDDVLRTQQYKEIILNTLKRYYKCTITKEKEFADVYVIYKNNVNLLKLNDIVCKEHEESGPVTAEEAKKIIEAERKKPRKFCMFDSNFNNEIFGLSYLLTNYTQKIIMIDENSVDDKGYHIIFKNHEEESIEGIEKTLTRYGLKFVKEKREVELYHFDFKK